MESRLALSLDQNVTRAEPEVSHAVWAQQQIRQACPEWSKCVVSNELGNTS